MAAGCMYKIGFVDLPLQEICGERLDKAAVHDFIREIRAPGATSILVSTIRHRPFRPGNIPGFTVSTLMETGIPADGRYMTYMNHW
jgi:hypothetical protein